MKPSQLLKDIQTLLSAKVELATDKLEDGTIIEAEAFESGMPVFIVAEDVKEPLLKGEYVMENGEVLVLLEDGIIAEIKPKAEEVAMADEVVEVPVAEEIVEDVKPIIDAVVEVIAPMIEEVKAEMETLKKKLAESEQKVEELSKVNFGKIEHTPNAPQKQAKTNDIKNRIFQKLV